MRRFMPLLVAAALVLSTAAANADLGDQLFKLLPDDGAAYDEFGESVAISGATAIVGASHDDDNGSGSGSAHLFDTTTGQWIAMLLPDDGASGDRFGVSVAISGTTAIVGAYVADNVDNGINSGSAYLFDTITGQQLAKLLPSDGAAFDGFGISVAVSGTTAIVGATGDDDNGAHSGSAYLFDTITGQQLAKLLPNDGVEWDLFGHSVAINSTTAIIGSARNDDVCPSDPECNSGSAYLFDVATGQQLHKLTAADAAEQDYFGMSVAISGTTAIVGAHYDDDNGINSGSAYLFDTATGWQIAKLLPDDGAEDDWFGWSVAISGTTAIVAAFFDDDNGTNSGSAYLFDTTTGRQIAKLLPDDGEELDYFGKFVAISGAAAIVGAYWDDDNGDKSGSAYLFDASACPWDLNGDGAVGPFDLALVLGFWGPNPGHPSDIDGDGEVGPFDLALVLGNWGPCP
ncbi:MAG: hypothetical protein IID34_07595 [Planctomycetes bacterium]|nr:hypothetical protein [Planctomycetota bacterium]